MQVKDTGFEGMIEIIPNIFPDDRGWFFECYREELLASHGLKTKFPQENMSFSKKGVIRGLHFQREPRAQGKLVRVVHGRVLDVAVDLRPQSKTFGKVYYCELDSKRQNMLMVPEGFAHGFSALEDSIFHYKCTNTYSKEHEGGIVWNDPELKIDWRVTDPIISKKDAELPTLKELLENSLISR